MDYSKTFLKIGSEHLFYSYKLLFFKTFEIIVCNTYICIHINTYNNNVYNIYTHDKRKQ